MFSCIEEVIDNASFIISVYDHELADSLVTQMNLLVWFIVAHSVVNLLGMSYGVYWAISRTNTQVRAMWKTLGLFSKKLEPATVVPDAMHCSTVSTLSQPLFPLTNPALKGDAQWSVGERDFLVIIARERAHISH